MNKMTLQQFEEALIKANSTRQLNEILFHFLFGFKINTYAYTYYSNYPTSLNKLKYDHCSENLNLWHKHYITEGYEDIDSTLEIVKRSTLPLFWSLEEQLSEAATPREIQMRKDSIDYGVEKGISIPIHGPQEDFAILMVAQMRGQTCLEDYSKIQYELFAAAYYFYNYMQNQLLKLHPVEENYKLSHREMQCLSLLAKQYSPAAIAQQLQITERTVNYHIQRLNKKLGTHNKYQSVIKALQKGLIKL
jgi:LuxR family transcriptional activator of bioluminescence operon